MNPMVLALLIMGVTILCFIFEPLPLVVVSITASLVYAFTGLIDMNAVFASYGTTTNILMIAMMVIGASLFHSGISELIGSKMAAFLTCNCEKKQVYIGVFHLQTCFYYA